jgi:flavodoxin
MKVLVIYHSRSGHTRVAAESIAQAVQGLGHSVSVKSVIEVNQSDVAQADAIFIGSWVHGFILFGVHPDGAEHWVPALPKFDGKNVGVFCTYAFNPRNSLQQLGKLLTARGAKIAGEQSIHRNRVGQSVLPFVQDVLRAANAPL